MDRQTQEKANEITPAEMVIGAALGVDPNIVNWIGRALKGELDFRQVDPNHWSEVNIRGGAPDYSSMSLERTDQPSYAARFPGVFNPHEYGSYAEFLRDQAEIAKSQEAVTDVTPVTTSQVADQWAQVPEHIRTAAEQYMKTLGMTDQQKADFKSRIIAAGNFPPAPGQQAGQGQGAQGQGTGQGTGQNQPLTKPKPPGNWRPGQPQLRRNPYLATGTRRYG